MSSTSPSLKPSVVIIDDDSRNLLALEVVLRSLNCQVISFPAAEEGLDYLERNEVAVIILDVWMPIINGIGVAKALRQRSENQRTPIIFATADVTTELARDCYRAGGTDFLIKPLDTEILVSKVSQYLELYENRHRQAVAQITAIEEKYKHLKADAEHFQAQLFELFLRSPIPMVMLKGPDHRFELINEPHRKMVGRDDLIGKTVAEAGIPGGDRFIELLDRVYQTGIPYKGKALPLLPANGDSQTLARFVNVDYYPSFDQDNKVNGIITMEIEVTDEVNARRVLELEKSAVEVERENFRNLFKQTPEMVCILWGPEHTFEFVNEAHIKALGFDATGMKVRDAQPESVEVHGILDDVYRTGKTAELHEIAITLTDRVRFFNLTYAARRDASGKINGVMILGIEVTNDVKMRELLEERESHFRGLVDTSPAIMWITDQEAKCTYLSRQWYALTGGVPENDLGYGWVEHVHPDDREASASAFFTAVVSKGPISKHYRLKHKDGTYRWMVDLGLPRISSEGEFLGYIGTVVDVHDQVSSEGELEILQTRFQKSAAATNLGLWYCDLPFNVLHWNSENKDHFFLPHNAHVTIDVFYERIHPEDRHSVQSAIEHSIENRTPYDIIYRTVNPIDPAQVKYLRAIGWTDYSSSGVPTRFDGITLDVSTDYKREAELRAAKDQAERANELQSAFLANMSHEIRTPLGAMIGFAELLRDPDLSKEEHSEYADIIKKNGSQLSELINDVLEFSKLEAGHATFESLQTEPIKIAQDVVELLKLKAKEKDLTLEFLPEVSTLNTVISDPTRIRQILVNLIGNALKFTISGGVRVRSYTKTVRDKNQIFFEVTDTGIGVPDDQRQRIFDLFVQADGSMTRKYGGTGIGLPLSRKLAQALGGDVLLRESSPSGSTFIFYFTDKLGTPITDIEAVWRDDVETSAVTQTSLDGIDILIVDDSKENRMLMSKFLKKHGAVTTLATNGAEAVESAMTGDFDVILMDIQMPIMDGYTATRKLREMNYQKPIIAITARSMSDVREACIDAGFTDQLPKPIKPDDLASVVKKHSQWSQSSIQSPPASTCS